MLRRVNTNRVSIVLVVSVAALVAACSGGTDSAAPSVTPVSAPPVVSSTPSPGTGGTVVGECTIAPDTQCSGAYLSMVSLAGMDLSGANLSGANMRKSDLRQLDLTGADLTDADIRDSDLTEATLVGADLTGARLRHANLSRADFTGATVTTGQLGSAYLCETVMPNGAKNSSGCEMPTSTPSPSTTASPTPTGPTITSFIAPEGSPPCPSSPPDASVTVKIRYQTIGATTVNFLIDGEDQGMSAGYKAKGGTAELPFSCSKSSHRYTIIASGNGSKAKQTATVYRT